MNQTSAIRDARTWIDQNYRNALDVRTIARYVGMEQTRLRRCFRRAYGWSLREYHVRRRVQAALTLMAQGWTKPTSIAQSVGYLSDKNFYRAVRVVTGTTPTALAQLDPAAMEALAQGLTSVVAGSRSEHPAALAAG